MSAAAILTAWIVLYAVHQAWEALLTLLNLRHAARHPEPPPELAGVVDAPAATRTQHYLRARSGLSLVSRGLRVAVTLAVVTGGVLGILDRWVAGILPALGIASPLLASVAILLLLGVASNLLALPIRIYGQFVIEQRFGFNRMTWRTFVLDLIKSTLLSLILGVPLLFGLFWFMAEAGALWWLYAFGFIAAFQLVMTFLYQPLIAPLFNRFQPLEESSLRRRLVALAQRLQFRVRSILVMDGSRRSRHSNAYFTGFGRAKRIVLFDTLLTALDEPQVEAVLAHEIGHEKRHHVGQAHRAEPGPDPGRSVAGQPGAAPTGAVRGVRVRGRRRHRGFQLARRADHPVAGVGADAVSAQPAAHRLVAPPRVRGRPLRGDRHRRRAGDGGGADQAEH